MPVLDNPKHEAFVQKYVRGISAEKAYIAAGYAKGGAAQAACKLLKTVKVKARLDEVRATVEKKVMEFTIADRQARVAALDDRWMRLKRVMNARAEDLKEVPGGDSGLLVHEVKGIGGGDSLQVIDEYPLDAALLKEFRAHEQQAAIELGQWKDGDSGGNQVNIQFVVSDQRL